MRVAGAGRKPRTTGGGVGRHAWSASIKRGTTRLLLSSLGALIVLGVAGCGLFSRGPEVRYRITIEVDTPQGLRTGSSVWSFQLRRGDLGQSYNPVLRGEAVAVDLPDGKTLYAPLVVQNSAGEVDFGTIGLLPETVLRRVGITRDYERQVLGDRAKVLQYIADHGSPPIQLDCADEPPECPMLVYFSDPAQPSTVQVIPPTDLESTLGKGISLRRMTLQITHDPITTGIAKRLTWIPKYKSKAWSLDGQRHSAFTDNDVKKLLGAGSFSSEVRR
jgi:hypothetical protein